MMEGWLCPRCHKVNAPWVSQCSCEDFWRDKITCNPCTTGAYPRDNWSVTTATKLYPRYKNKGSYLYSSPLFF